MRAPWRDRRGRVSWVKAAALAVVCVPGLSMVHDWTSGGFGPLPFIGLVYWSGVWAVGLILLTLAVTPARALFRAPWLIDARRIFGVATLVYTLVHVAAFAGLYKWDWPAVLRQTFTRPSLLVATASLIGLIALGATSSDAAVQRLGGRAWNRLHRANYAVSILALAHFLLSPGIFGLQYSLTGLLFWLLAWRVLDRRAGARTPLALAGLTVAATLFVVALEIAWLLVWQDQPPGETIETIFSLEDEVAPPWVVLASGLAVMVLAAAWAAGSKRLAAGEPGVSGKAALRILPGKRSFLRREP
ncbi:ferric reductase-like transmembrane domain-containing protein [Alsobacter sp. SYSU M60028]|uniref:Ferric reductase-like transmembrane domain-containing protein n=1 Tax=Alsobacter ponti TaxID=2962936 RepID=A0ABT1L7H3_9HYPH|nr:ferric reductase-like transmembrane domain-containing protein [Alsobacter ponti]MCP8936906.1 ferric reductase-like transmembrane domain-containing protein [Alsobacter ponti]